MANTTASRLESLKKRRESLYADGLRLKQKWVRFRDELRGIDAQLETFDKSILREEMKQLIGRRVRITSRSNGFLQLTHTVTIGVLEAVKRTRCIVDCGADGRFWVRVDAVKTVRVGEPAIQSETGNSN
ncbi:MAG: hypothetical protein ACYC3X_22605 [Pirellulaceae bacterium]